MRARHRDIMILYHVDNRLVDAASLFKAIGRTQRKVKAALGFGFENVEIEIYTGRDEWIERHTMLNERDAPSWVQGDSGRVIRLIANEHRVKGSKELALMVCHECVHSAVRNRTLLKAPAWMDEGLAIYLCQDIPGEYEKTMDEAARADALIPFELLRVSFNRLDRKMKSLAYAQSYSLVRYMVDSYGWDIIRELLEAYRMGNREDEALRRRGLNLYLLEKEWVRRMSVF